MGQLYTTAKAAKYLGLSIPALKYHIYAGNVEPQRIGHTLVFSQEQLDEFEQNKRGPGRPRKETNNELPRL